MADVQRHISEEEQTSGLHAKPGYTQRALSSQGNYPHYNHTQHTSDSVHESNHFSRDPVIGNGASSHPGDGEEPEQYYKDYKGSQTTNNYSADSLTRDQTKLVNNMGHNMAAVQANEVLPGSIPLVAGRRLLVTPNYRSVSAPLSGIPKPNSTTATPGPSKVKDLLKKFDSGGNEASATPRSYSRSNPTKKDVGGASGVVKARAGYMAQIHGGAKTFETGSPVMLRSQEGYRARSASTQRNRFVAEDQHSANALASTPRAVRPRGASSTESTGTIPFPSLPIQSSTDWDAQRTHSESNLAINRASDRDTKTPLFGEVVAATDAPSAIAGYGIPQDHVSAPNIPNSPLQSIEGLNDKRRAPQSTSDAEWSAGEQTDIRDSKKADLADVSADLMQNVNSSALQARNALSTHTNDPAWSSKLPVSTSYRTTASAESSPPSPYSGPSFHQRRVTAQKVPLLTPDTQSLVPRPITPSDQPRSPNRPSSRTAARRREAKTASTLTAYVSSPPLATSPQLRSSRPRQHVYSTSTETARPFKIGEDEPVVSIASHRATRASPSKTGRSERSKMEDIDLAEMASAAARIKQKMVRTYSQQQHRQANGARRGKDSHVGENQASMSTTIERTLDILAADSRRLQLSTALPPRPQFTMNETEFTDSPTLGGITQTFVKDDDYPASVASARSNTTHIDADEQTEQARRRHSGADSDTIPSSPKSTGAGHKHYRPTPETIRVMLSPGKMGRSLEPTPTKDEFGLPRPAYNRIDYHGDANGLSTPLTQQKEFIDLHETTPITDRARAEKILAMSHIAYECHPFTLADLEYPSEENYRGNRNRDSREVNDAACESEPESTTCMDKESGQAALEQGRPKHRNSYDPFREPAPDFSDSIWADSRSHSKQNKANSLRVSNIFRESNPPQMERLVSPMSPESPMMPFLGAEYSAYPSPGSQLSPGLPDQYGHNQHTPHIAPASIYTDEYRSPNSSTLATPNPVDGSNGFTQHSRGDAPDGTLDISVVNSRANPTVVGLGILETSTAGESPVRTTWSEQDPESAVSNDSALPAPTSHTSEAPSLSGRYSVELSRPPSHSPPPPFDMSTQVSSARDSQCYSEKDYMPASSFKRDSSSPCSADLSRVASARPSVTMTFEDIEHAEAERNRLTQRTKAIEEIVTSEAVYLKDLTIIQSLYKGTASSCPALSPEDIKTIFINLDEVVTFSDVFTRMLKNCTHRADRLRRHHARVSKGSISSAQTNDTPTSLLSSEQRMSRATTLVEENERRQKADERTDLAAAFLDMIPELRKVYGTWIKLSKVAHEHLIEVQKNPDVQVWLQNCDEGIKGLTGAWNLPALLVKPMQRATKYSLLIDNVLKFTHEGHPEHASLIFTRNQLADFCVDINSRIRDPKKPAKITTRKRKESDVRFAFKSLLTRRAKTTPTKTDSKTDIKDANVKVQVTNEDELFQQLANDSGNDYLTLQLVLRDVELVSRQSAEWVQTFLKYLSAIEVVVRPSKIPGDAPTPSAFPEIESKWIGINKSMADMGSVALGDYVSGSEPKLSDGN